MALNFGGDSWLSEFSACEAEATEIMQKITLCIQQKGNSTMHVQMKVKITQMMKQFNLHIRNLREKLIRASSLYQITQGEVDRRERMLDNLANKGKQMEESFTEQAFGSGNSRSERTALLGPDFGQTAVVSWGEEDSMTRNLTTEEIRQQQQQVIDEQDRGLESLHSIVIRQKRMAQGIGDELDTQNEIIDDIIDHTDTTTDRLIRERRHTEIVSRKSGTCGYWVVIILLLIAIIVVLAVPNGK